jgi:hypothetical protein
MAIMASGVAGPAPMAVIAVLADGMSEENVAIVVAELIDGEVLVVANDVAAAQSVRVPAAAARARVQSTLESVGWHLDAELSDRPLCWGA